MATNAPHPRPFGAQLKRDRQASGLTQAQLAQRVGYTTNYVSMLERGVRVPTPATAALLASALQLAAAERTELLATLRDETRSPLGPMLATAPVPPLVGRAAELAGIERHLSASGPPLLLLTGEPGIGKTRLLREATFRARDRGWCVLGAGSRRTGGQGPYAPLPLAMERYIHDRSPAHLRAALRDCSWLVRLLPELAERGLVAPPTWVLAPEQERRLMFAAVARFLSAIAGPSGTLLTLDDVQWTGPDALDLIAALVRYAAEEGQPLRLILAYRQTDLQDNQPLATLQADLAREGMAARLALGPLDPTQAAMVVRSVLDTVGADDLPSGEDATTALVEQMVRRAGGVPFYLVSCAQSAATPTPRQDQDDAHDARVADQTVALGPDAVPWTVSENIRQRVAALPATSHQVLNAAAIIGRPAAGDLLQACVRQSDDQFVVGLEAACQSGLLVEELEDVYRCAHDLIREVVETDIPSRRRKTLHRRVAEALAQSPGELPAMELANHYALAGDETSALLYLERAGDVAIARYAHREAERIFRELATRLEARHRDLDAMRARERLGAVLLAEARYDDALAALDAAARAYQARHDDEALGHTLAQIGWVHAEQGTPDTGVARLRTFLDAPAAPAISPKTRAELSLALARLYKGNGRYAEMLRAAEEAVTGAIAADEPLVRARAEKDRGTALLMLGRNTEGARVLEAAIPLVEAAGDLLTLAHALNNLSVVHETHGRFDLAQHDLARAVEAAERVGDPALIAFMVNRGATNAFETGDWARARAGFERAWALVEPIGQSWARAYILSGLGRLQIAMGAYDDGAAQLDRGLAIARQMGDTQAIQGIQAIRSEPDLLAGRFAEVVERLAPLLAQEGDPGVVLPPLLIAYDALGQSERADELLARALATMTADDNQMELVNMHRVRAVVLARRGHWEEAEAAALESLRASHTMGLGHSEIVARFTLGDVMRLRGDEARARTEFDATLRLCRQIGERLYAEQIERLLS